MACDLIGCIDELLPDVLPNIPRPGARAIMEQSAIVSSAQYEEMCEWRRTQGQSGFVNVRQYNYGGHAPFHRPLAHSYALLSQHNHPNHYGLLGMAQASYCVNGIYGRLRHTDYTMARPIQGAYLATEPLPMPDVPPSVLAKATAEEQIDEMREYFIALANTNPAHRDYRPYFRVAMSYLEVWHEDIGDGSISDTFPSERHEEDIANLHEAIAKVQLQNLTGHQGRSENTPFRPQAVRYVTPGGTPHFAIVQHRVACVELGTVQDYPPCGCLEQICDPVVLGSGLDMEEPTRNARFRVRPTIGGAWGTTRRNVPSLIDEWLGKVPGLNGGGSLTETHYDDAAFGPYTVTKYGTEDPLNAANYNRYYSTPVGASGRTRRQRGYNDPTLWVASTTQAKVAGVVDPYNTAVTRRCSYAVPLEVLILTPLSKWNPYNIPELPAKPTGDGKTAATAYSGMFRAGNFSMTPKALFGPDAFADPADTGGKSVWMQTPAGPREVMDSGISVYVPNIEGAGLTRTRWPIPYFYHEGHPAYAHLMTLADHL